MSSVGGAPSPKRRKLRKGTQSCWECKRRKTRCTFATAAEAICDGCRSRCTPCVGQEYPEASTGHKAASDGRQRHMEPVGSQPWPTTFSIGELAEYENPDALSRLLLAAWPSQHDLDLISTVPVNVSVIYHGAICMPYAKFFSSKHILSPQQILCRPTETSHPVLMARRLLLLAVLLQSIQPCVAVTKLASMTSDYRSMMTRLVNTASRLVTSNDQLITTLESIECVMVESMYLNNAGYLRRAWVTNRRAMTMAQMLGLHKEQAIDVSKVMTIEAETRERIMPDYMWARLVFSDRYLSLMLGFPQGCQDNVFASPEALDGCTPMEKLERIRGVAGGLILQRNHAERTDLAATLAIDKILLDSASLMPPRWWLIPATTTSSAEGAEAYFHDVIRVMTQMTHYHLLVQLHLPYLLLPAPSPSEYDYSKMSAASASRAILTRFVSFRSPDPSTAYCRGIDFIAFISSTTLCIAHIESQRQRHVHPGTPATAFQSLEHERLSDRGLLEQALKIMETMAEGHKDAVAQKIAAILRPLLEMEGRSAMGDCCRTSTSLDTPKQDEGVSGTSESLSKLRIHIPYFGTVKIEHNPADAGVSVHRRSGLEPLLQNRQDTDQRIRASGSDHHAGSPTRTSRAMDNSEWSALPSFIDQLGALPPSVSTTRNAEFTDSAEARLDIPSPAIEAEDWALQGLDTALFSSLIQGHEEWGEDTIEMVTKQA
ncbi:hypothetical protein S7711_08269 [Stachybotrys chartarum IBT 7711]|uniref:Zn(2)-C6 fungal-type domain-containing protein n=1 Tax=Stachybotrys chartarum (strain CBS 109288 / IBT 7711) TaxID=1280523 RepID=A0A084AQL7_STACB|nr:hypothetical protein S7711_08269 [Stachybotrys chartarum IBT 7711]KFA56052.1 hypothetical protein S40293_00162 [Stachybotrys chartarum IBT 40293]